MRFSDVNRLRALSVHKCLRSIVTSGTWPAIDPELRSKSKQQNHWDMTGSKSPTGSTGSGGQHPMIAIQAAFRSHWQSIHDYTAHRVLIHQDIGILVRTKFRYSFLFPSNERLIFFESFEQQMILHEAKFQ